MRGTQVNTYTRKQVNRCPERRVFFPKSKGKSPENNCCFAYPSSTTLRFAPLRTAVNIETKNIIMDREPMKCCFKGCFNSDEETLIPLSISLTHDMSFLLYAHDQCFISRCHPDVTFDNPKEHGRIPKNAKCIFCGDRLPIIGLHPYCFDFGNFVPPHRYWAHSQCMRAMVNPENWQHPNTDSSGQH